jgi:hypothetical protein
MKGVILALAVFASTIGTAHITEAETGGRGVEQTSARWATGSGSVQFFPFGVVRLKAPKREPITAKNALVPTGLVL